MIRKMVVLGMVLVLGYSFGFTNYGWAEEEGLVGCWHFDEGEGDIAKDSSGNHNDGKIQEGVKWVKGKLGYGLEFDGMVDTGAIEEHPSLDLRGKSFTVEAWIKTEEGGGIVSLCSSNWGFWRFVISEMSGKASFAIRDYDTHIASSAKGTTVVNDDQWHHIVGVRDYKNKLKLYVDGHLDNEVEDKTGAQIHWHTHHVYIGSPGFEGIIDEVRLYRRVLTAEEIKNHYEK